MCRRNGQPSSLSLSFSLSLLVPVSPRGVGARTGTATIFLERRQVKPREILRLTVGRLCRLVVVEMRSQRVKEGKREP